MRAGRRGVASGVGQREQRLTGPGILDGHHLVDAEGVDSVLLVLRSRTGVGGEDGGAVRAIEPPGDVVDAVDLSVLEPHARPFTASTDQDVQRLLIGSFAHALWFPMTPLAAPFGPRPTGTPTHVS